MATADTLAERRTQAIGFVAAHVPNAQMLRSVMKRGGAFLNDRLAGPESARPFIPELDGEAGTRLSKSFAARKLEGLVNTGAKLPPVDAPQAPKAETTRPNLHISGL